MSESIDNAEIDPYFNVNLEGDVEKSQLETTELVDKVLLKNLFGSSNKLVLTGNVVEPRINGVDATSEPTVEQKGQETEIFNAMGLNLEKKFRFGNIFKQEEIVDDITAMMMPSPSSAPSLHQSETDDHSANGTTRHGTASYSDGDDDDSDEDDGSAAAAAAIDRRKSRESWSGGEGLSTNKLAMMLNDMQVRSSIQYLYNTSLSFISPGPTEGGAGLGQPVAGKHAHRHPSQWR